MFEELTQSIRDETVRSLFRVALVAEPAPSALTSLPPRGAPLRAARPASPQRQMLSHAAVSAFGTPEKAGGPEGTAPPGPATLRQAPVTSHEPKVGRNDPCPCGSGKKYKKCHGA